MKQYHDLLKNILQNGTLKPAARANMPGTISLFGHQFRHDLAYGFPASTTKKLYWKGVVVELLWFLRGDTNIKFLDNYKVRKMWHQDAYNYYKKIACENENDSDVNNIYVPCNNTTNTRNCKVEEADSYSMFTFEEFCDIIKTTDRIFLPSYKNYTLGDCGYQYGKIWRKWERDIRDNRIIKTGKTYEDQIANLINGLKNSPEGRRHLLTAIDPSHDTDLALYWCHVLAQFNCRPFTRNQGWERYEMLLKMHGEEYLKDKYKNDPRASWMGFSKFKLEDANYICDLENIPKYKLDCHMYQRSADVFLGVPLNIASYALLTHLLCEICNMIPGEMIYSYGDVHIYQDHMDAVNEQLSRTCTDLPKLSINTEFWMKNPDTQEITTEDFLLQIKDDNWVDCFLKDDLQLYNYNPMPTIEANLSTGLKK